MVLLAACVTASVETVARAQETSEDVARAHFVLGQAAYDEGRFATALEEFDKAYAASKRPALLYNIGVCHERLGRFAEAVDHYKRYLRELPDAADRDAVQARVADLEERIAEAAKLQPKPPPTLAATASAPPPERKPVYKRGWFWGVVVGAVVVAGVGVGLGVGLSRGGTVADSFMPNLPVGGPGAH